jgi:hypothetical protein
MYYNLICIFICTPICTKKIILVKSGCYNFYPDGLDLASWAPVLLDMLPTRSREDILSNMRKALSLTLGILKSLYPGPTWTLWVKASRWHALWTRPINWLRTPLWWWSGSSRCSRSTCRMCRIDMTACGFLCKMLLVFFLLKLMLSWMNLIIVRLISFMCRFETCLNINSSTCWSNVLDLIPYIDKGFAHMLART